MCITHHLRRAPSEPIKGQDVCMRVLNSGDVAAWPQTLLATLKEEVRYG